MAIINKGTDFSNGEQLSASKLNSLVDGATLGTDSVDNASTIVNANGAITVRDSGVTTAKLATDAVTTAKLATDAVTTAKILDANVTTAKIEDSTSTITGVTTAKIADSSVTKAKMENISAPLKVLGRTTAGAGVVEEVTINDDNAMSNASASTLATDASIKQYVDTAVGSADAFDPATYVGGETTTLPNGLIMKFGVQTYTYLDGNSKTVTFGTAFPNSCISVVYSSESVDFGSTYISSKSTTAFTVYSSSTDFNRKFNWQAIGY